MQRKLVMEYYNKKAKKLGLKGGQQLIAEICGITQPAVSNWPGRIPEKHAMRLNAHTRGRLAYRREDYHKNANRRCRR